MNHGIPILIVGGDGIIGSGLSSFLQNANQSVIPTTRRKICCSPTRPYLDLQDPSTFANAIEIPIHTAVFCGGITSIQSCEAQQQLTRSVNVTGTLQLAKALSSRGTHIIYISSNMVFDGTKPLASSADIKSPLTEYGRQKAEVEDRLNSEVPLSTIIRFGKVLQPAYPLFAEWHDNMKKGNVVTAFTDKLFAPISLELACKVISWSIANRKDGLLQITSEPEISYHESALHLANYYKLDSNLIHKIHCDHNLGREGRLGSTTLALSPELRNVFGVPSPLEALKYSFANL